MNKYRIHKLLISGIYIGNIVVVSLFWLYGTMLHQSLTAANVFTGFGRISGLLAVIFVLAELLMMARVPLIEKAYSLDELTRIHRVNGYLALSLLLLHATAITIGYQLVSHSSFIGQFISLSLNYEDVIKGVLGLLLFIIVTISSIRLARKHVSYEVWYFIHLLAYLAVVLAFGHQLKIGTDFIGRPLFVLYWYSLYALTALLIGWYRFAVPLLSLWRYRLRVTNIRNEAHNTYTISLAGRGLSDLKYQAGQFAVWYFLAPKFWWQGHPFSISSNYGEDTIDITVKASGDYTKLLSNIKVGTPVLIDGPHGKFTLDKAGSKKILMIAGGVGITPIYSMLKNIHTKEGHTVTLLNGCRDENEIIFKNQLQNLAKQPHINISYYFSDPKTGQAQFIDKQKLEAIADLASYHIFICGPTEMMDSITSILLDLGVPKNNIHTERFYY